MNVKIINIEKAPKAVGPYSQGILADGFYFFSGQLGINPSTSKLVEGFAAQLEQIMENIDGLLTSEGLSRSDIIKTTIFMTDLKKFGEVNAIYQKFFQAPYPARSTIQVAALPLGGEIEIEVIAKKK